MDKRKYYYVKLDVPGNFFESDILIDPEIYRVGTTIEDYLDNYMILLSKEQVKFHEDNLTATGEEILEMKLNSKLWAERAKAQKLQEIEEYDNSDNINSFTINNTITTWFTPEQRLQYKQSIEAAKLMGIESLQFFVNDVLLDISTEQAEKMLATLQLYADTCYIVTRQHKLNVESFNTVEEIDNYNYTKGYPKKLNFGIE